MQLKRAYSAEPISEETTRRLNMGRGRTRLFGAIACVFGFLLIPAGITGFSMGYFRLESKTVTVFPKLLSESEAKAEDQKIAAEAEALRKKRAEEKTP